MKVKVLGNAMVITSEVRLSDIIALAKSNPDALVLYEGEGEKRHQVFRVGLCIGGEAKISDKGVVFNGKTGPEEHVTVSLILPGNPANPREYVADTYGIALKRLKAWEETVPGIMAAAKAEKDAILALIED